MCRISSDTLVYYVSMQYIHYYIWCLYVIFVIIRFQLVCNKRSIIKKVICFQAAPPIDPTHAIAIAVVEAAMKAGAAAILVCTASGASAKLICRYLPRVPVIAITRYGRVARQLSLFKAAVPYHYVGKLWTVSEKYLKRY